jgi:hypothetical protein
MRPGFRATALFLALLLVPRFAATQSRVREVYVRVLDSAGTPVPGLGTADFEVQEGGVARRITRVGPASSTMRIALLVDNGELTSPALMQLRAGLSAFVDAVPDHNEIAFATIARRFRLRVPPTTDRSKVKDSISVLIGDSGSGSALLDGVFESHDAFFRKVDNRRPVIVIVTSEGGETRSILREELNARINAVIDRGVTVHAIVLRHPGQGRGNELELCTDLTRWTGGHLDMIGANTESLPDKLKAIGALVADAHRRMTTEYQVEFLSDAGPPQAIQIGATRRGLRIEASQARYRE